MTDPAVSLRSLRLERGWSLRHVAQQLQITAAQLSDLERGKGAMAGVTLRLARLYDVAPAALLPPLPAGLAALLAQPDIHFSPEWIQTLCRLEFRSGRPLSADDWWTLSDTLQRALP